LLRVLAAREVFFGGLLLDALVFPVVLVRQLLLDILLKLHLSNEWGADGRLETRNFREMQYLHNSQPTLTGRAAGAVRGHHDCDDTPSAVAKVKFQKDIEEQLTDKYYGKDQRVRSKPPKNTSGGKNTKQTGFASYVYVVIAKKKRDRVTCVCLLWWRIRPR